MTCKEAVYSNEVYDYITDFPIENTGDLSPVVCYADIENRYNIVYLDRTSIPNMETNFFEYQSVPKLYGLMQEVEGSDSDRFFSDSQVPYDPTSLIASGITQMQTGPLQLTGRGVTICFIDTGIDYTNGAFRDAYGDSRILAIWDQTIEEGEPPEGFFYGAEYSRADINRALQSENPFAVVPSRDTDGHGTALAGISVGRGNYLGAAPEADLVVVKLKEAKQYLREFYLIPEGVPAYQENDLMLAVKYCESFAVLLKRPVVICLGVGTNMGDHAGSSALSAYLGMVAVRRNRAVVICGGNEGNAGHHFQGRLQEENPFGSMNYEDVEVRVGEGNAGFIMELWGTLPDIVNVSVRSPGGEVIPPIRVGVRQSVTYDFVYERTRITIDSSLVEASSGEELMLFRLKDPTPGIWTFRVMSVGEISNGLYHMWLPITQFLSSEVSFLRGTPEMTLTEPAYALGAIAVSYYDAYSGAFAISSGRGFGRTGQIRPDLCAPGVNVSAIRGARSGSSAAAAITAGAVAQFLQWAVVEGNARYAESIEIQSYLILGAVRDATLFYPNREWGYGKLNLLRTFERLSGV